MLTDTERGANSKKISDFQNRGRIAGNLGVFLDVIEYLLLLWWKLIAIFYDFWHSESPDGSLNFVCVHLCFMNSGEFSAISTNRVRPFMIGAQKQHGCGW